MVRKKKTALNAMFPSRMDEFEESLDPPDVDPVLRFTPVAWAKLQFFCHRGDTEIGGFGVACADDLLVVEDFVTVTQRASFVGVSFDDEAVADHFDSQVTAGRRPEQFARIWCHTHPGDCPRPSGVDEETFARVFGQCEWAVMFILARQGQTYARLQFNVGPRGAVRVPVTVDYSRPFGPSDHDDWELEYGENVHVENPTPEAFAFTWPDGSGAGQSHSTTRRRKPRNAPAAGSRTRRKSKKSGARKRGHRSDSK